MRLLAAVLLVLLLCSMPNAWAEETQDEPVEKLRSLQNATDQELAGRVWSVVKTKDTDAVHALCDCVENAATSDRSASISPEKTAQRALRHCSAPLKAVENRVEFMLEYLSSARLSTGQNLDEIKGQCVKNATRAVKLLDQSR